MLEINSDNATQYDMVEGVYLDWRTEWCDQLSL